MTPEIAAYHHAMLLVGFFDRFYQDFEDALATEDPLSDLILSLCTCVSDQNQVIAILHEYTLDYTVDEDAVLELIVADLRERYIRGELSRKQVISVLYDIAWKLGGFWDEPWHSLVVLDYALEEWEDGLICEEVFNIFFDAWLFRRETLDTFALQREWNKRKKINYLL